MEFNHWLIPAEQRKVVRRLLEFGLIKFDNKRSLKTKSGRLTDIYINLRDARGNPEALKYISGLYSNPLGRLGVSRFAEIPQAVSCFAGIISVNTGLPYTTIRDQEKAGRVTNSQMVSPPALTDKVTIIDDVVTDGRSKLGPIRTLQNWGCGAESLVVLVDRQQGWRKVFQSEGITTPIWSGMTLHDVRRTLIESGQMMRCDESAETNNPIILALDGRDWESVLPIIDELRPTGCILKVNDLAFGLGAEWLVPNLAVYGRVMVDCKGHDIPTTVANITKWLLPTPPWAVTVHASGGSDMVGAAVQTLKTTKTNVLAVTVLTSFDPETCREIYHETPRRQVEKLAQKAMEAGAHGLVCSPKEVKFLRNKYPNALLVTPGVRSPGADVGVQSRVDTPANSLACGASHVVMGSQILSAGDPVQELMRVLKIELGK